MSTNNYTIKQLISVFFTSSHFVESKPMGNDTPPQEILVTEPKYLKTTFSHWFNIPKLTDETRKSIYRDSNGKVNHTRRFSAVTYDYAALKKEILDFHHQITPEKASNRLAELLKIANFGPDLNSNYISLSCPNESLPMIEYLLDMGADRKLIQDIPIFETLFTQVMKFDLLSHEALIILERLLRKGYTFSEKAKDYLQTHIKNQSSPSEFLTKCLEICESYTKNPIPVAPPAPNAFAQKDTKKAGDSGDAGDSKRASDTAPVTNTDAASDHSGDKSFTPQKNMTDAQKPQKNVVETQQPEQNILEAQKLLGMDNSTGINTPTDNHNNLANQPSVIVLPKASQ